MPCRSIKTYVGIESIPYAVVAVADRDRRVTQERVERVTHLRGNAVLDPIEPAGRCPRIRIAWSAR
jgi:hypothetical protein